jgi:hypothetical protein
MTIKTKQFIFDNGVGVADAINKWLKDKEITLLNSHAFIAPESLLFVLLVYFENSPNLIDNSPKPADHHGNESC